MKLILSPHCDDAVLSLGASIAADVENGMRVRVLTVFANETDKERPLVDWDRRGGFESNMDAARARRIEDREALAVVGAEGVYLSYPDSSYITGVRDEDAVLLSLCEIAGDATEWLVPGYPLVHRDHAWLSDLLVRRTPAGVTVRFYVEQPYAWWNRVTPLNRMDFEQAPTKLRHLRKKLAAIRCYKSQLPMLGGTKLFAALAVNDLIGSGEAFVPEPATLAARRGAGASTEMPAQPSPAGAATRRP